MLTPTLQKTADLFGKLERERYRAFHATHITHTADHLYNFCVTAVALRDWLFGELEWSSVQREQFHLGWRADEVLDACADIANSSKHCTLRNGPSSHSAIASKTTVIDIYTNGVGEVYRVPNPNHPEVLVTLSSGRTLGLYELTEAVLGAWRGLLLKHGINLPSQDFASLSGQAT